MKIFDSLSNNVIYVPIDLAIDDFGQKVKDPGIDGSCDSEVRKNLYNHLAEMGEPLQFGIKDGQVESFLAEKGFSRAKNVTTEEYKKSTSME